MPNGQDRKATEPGKVLPFRGSGVREGAPHEVAPARVKKGGTEAARTARQGSDPWEAVREWTGGVLRHYVPRSAEDPLRLCEAPGAPECEYPPLCLWHAGLDPKEARFIQGAEAKKWGATNHYWRAFAMWILSRAGLPGPEDGGERRPESAQPSWESHLSRAFARFDPDSTEYWALYVEHAFRIGQGPSAVQEFLGALQIIPLRHHAAVGGKFIGRERQPGKGTARALAPGWMKRLPKLGEGERRSNIEAAEWILEHCADAEDFSVNTIRRSLPKRRAKKNH